MIRSLLLSALIFCIVVPAHAFNVEKLIMDGASRIRESAPAEEAPAAPTSRNNAPSAGEDDHYIQQDDFFFSERPMGTNAWIYVSLAKMTTPPSPQSKGEGEFFKVTDGSSHWSKFFWKARIARPEEIRLGATMIMFEGRTLRGVYQAPDKKSTARHDHWFMARITDTSDLYKGFVTVSGGYKVSPGNLRVIVP